MIKLIMVVIMTFAFMLPNYEVFQKIDKQKTKHSALLMMFVMGVAKERNGISLSAKGVITF